VNTGSRLQRLQALFHQAVELDLPEQAAFLDQACADDPQLRAELSALLVQDRRGDDDATIAARVLPLARQLADADADVNPALRDGARIGGYRLEREIGSGGMGSVFLARREDREFQHEVAIKLVRGFPTSPVLERFRRERELLAGLRHPNIARLFDGGTTDDGQPYLVMEYVDGVPLDAWCAQRKPGLAARLRLFQALCSAVQHAHQQLVVHRDLKPANILVRADGQPVLLDFGIGKLLDEDDDGREATQLRALTPAYASPEQLRGDPVTTLSDIYALGLILFELLAGVPLRKQRGDTTGLVASKVAAHGDGWLRADAAQLRGDLDNVVRKALREEPARRYPSAGAMAADIQAWFERRPVSAAPDDWRYRLGKFIARHPVAIGATVATIVLLTGLSLRLAVERDRALDAQAQARIEAEGANQQAEFLVDVFKLASPENIRGSDMSIRDLVDAARADLEGRQFGRDEVKARLEVAVGEIYTSLGVPETSIELLDEAVSRLRQGGDGVDGRVLAKALLEAGRAHTQGNRNSTALPMLEESLALNRALQPPGHPSIAHSLMSLGVVEHRMGRSEQAQARFAEAQAIFAAAGDDHRGNRAAAVHNLGWAIGGAGRPAEALALLEQALAEKREVYGPLHPSTFNTLQVMANQEGRLGRHDAAVARFQELLDALRTTLGEGSAKVASTLNEMASTLQDAGDLAQAERRYLEAIAHNQRHRTGPSLEQALPINNLGTLYEAQERHAEAEAQFRRSLALRESLGHDLASIARARHNLARVLLAQGRNGDARDLAQAALAQRLELLPPGHGERVDSLLLVARIELADGRLQPARLAVARVQAEADAGGPALAPAVTARWHEARAELDQAAGNLAGAMAWRQQQLDVLAARLRADDPQLARVRLAMAALALDQDQPATARRLLEPAAPVLERLLDPDAPSRLWLAALQARLAAGSG
jgi:serine/threonine-protein kinase